MIRTFLFILLLDIKHSVLIICSSQHYSISPQHYAEIFASSGTIFSNIDALRCVYNCIFSGEDIGLRLAVYHQEPKLCSCVTRIVPKSDVQNAVEVQVVEVSKGWYSKYGVVLKLEFVHLQYLYLTICCCKINTAVKEITVRYYRFLLNLILLDSILTCISSH